MRLYVLLCGLAVAQLRPATLVLEGHAQFELVARLHRQLAGAVNRFTREEAPKQVHLQSSDAGKGSGVRTVSELSRAFQARQDSLLIETKANGPVSPAPDPPPSVLKRGVTMPACAVAPRTKATKSKVMERSSRGRPKMDGAMKREADGGFIESTH
jgi:hypothetical protein